MRTYVVRALVFLKRFLLGWLHVGRYPLLRKLRHRLLAAGNPGSVVIDGDTLSLDPGNSLQLGLGTDWQPAMRRYMAGMLEEGDVVYDVGAHIGVYSLLFARAVGPSGKVYSFEPVPELFKLLEKNAQANGYSSIEAVNKAVSDRSGSITIYLSEDNSGDHRGYDSQDGRGAVDAESVALDDFSSGRERPRLVKLDIQGMERRALAGMKSLLETSPETILVVEFWPYGLALAGTDPREFLSLLDELGYRTCMVADDGQNIRETAARDLLIQCTVRNQKAVDLVCTRRHPQ